MAEDVFCVHRGIGEVVYACASSSSPEHVAVLTGLLVLPCALQRRGLARLTTWRNCSLLYTPVSNLATLVCPIGIGDSFTKLAFIFGRRFANR